MTNNINQDGRDVKISINSLAQPYSLIKLDSSLVPTYFFLAHFSATIRDFSAVRCED